MKRSSSGFLLLIFFIVGMNLVIKFPSSCPTLPDCSDFMYIELRVDSKSAYVYEICHHNIDSVLKMVEGTPNPYLISLLKRADLKSGDSIIIHNKTHVGIPVVKIGSMSGFYRITLGIPLSLNRDDEEAFSALPGIGLITGRAIVKERLRRGGFKSIDEIKYVRGISDGIYKKIAPFLKL
jgi:hypothetical protein